MIREGHLAGRIVENHVEGLCIQLFISVSYIYEPFLPTANNHHTKDLYLQQIFQLEVIIISSIMVDDSEIKNNRKMDLIFYFVCKNLGRFLVMYGRVSSLIELVGGRE